MSSTEDGLQKKWGIDEKAKTPAFTHEDGEDFVPSSKFTVFSHQFSSIAGAGPVTGPILASVFGWVPVLLWLLIGGLFFGAVQDFGALYASVKNEGKSMGMIIEKYIGKTGRKLFMLFCWLFTLLVIAAFTDMVAGTFVGTGLEDAGVAYANGSAASISMLFILVAVIFGLIQKKVGKMNEWVKAVVAIGLLVVMFAVGMKLPIYASKTTWIYIIMAYLFLASVMPMWLLMQPRDYMTTFMLLGMIIGAVLGVVVAHPDMELNAFNGFQVGNSSLFPTLFVTIACGAVSGFHSLVSSGTSSKTISNEKDMPMVGYGAMIVDILADQAFKLFVIPLLLFGIAQVVFHRLAHLLNIFLLLTDAPGPKLLQLILTFYFLFQLTYFADSGIFHRDLRRLREHCAFFFSLFFLFFHFGVLFLCVIR
jgi:carbon starvation protein